MFRRALTGVSSDIGSASRAERIKSISPLKQYSLKASEPQLAAGNVWKSGGYVEGKPRARRTKENRCSKSSPLGDYTAAEPLIPCAGSSDQRAIITIRNTTIVVIETPRLRFHSGTMLIYHSILNCHNDGPHNLTRSRPAAKAVTPL